MKEEMLKLLMKKKGMEAKDMSEDELKAKREAIMELIEMAKEMSMGKMKGDMEGLQKVTVMAPDKEKLKEGLEVAEDTIEATEDEDESEDESQDMMPEMDKSPETATLENEEDEEYPKKKRKMSKLFSMMDDE